MSKHGTSDVARNADDAADGTIESIKDTVKGFVDQGAQKVETLKTKVVEAKDQAFTRGNDVIDRACDVIKAHPIKSVAIAFAVGYVGMRLFR